MRDSFYIDMVSENLGVILNYADDYSTGVKVATFIKEPNQLNIILNDNIDSDMACDIYDFVSRKYPSYYAPDEILMESKEEIFGEDLAYPAGVVALNGITLDIPTFSKPEDALISSDTDEFEDEDFSRGGNRVDLDNLSFGLDKLVAEDDPEITFTEKCDCKWYLVKDVYPQNEDIIYFVDIDGNLGIGSYNEDMHAVAMSDGLGVMLEDIKQWAYADYREVVGYPCDGETVAIEMPDIDVPALAMYTDSYVLENGERCRAAILSPIYEFEGQEGDVVVDWSLVTTWYRVPEIKPLRALELPELEAEFDDYSAEKEDPDNQHLLTTDIILDAAKEANEESNSAIVNSKQSAL